MTNKDQIFDLLQTHPEGLDDDDIADLTGIQPRQQVQNLCNQLATAQRIRRESVAKPGKRRKIHNFPVEEERRAESPEEQAWRKRLSALVAVTGRDENILLDEALQALAVKVLKENTAE